MNPTVELDDETALFLREQTTEKLQKLSRSLQMGETVWTKIDLQTLRELVKRYNEALNLCDEFVHRHPEDTELAQRAGLLRK